MSLILLYGVAIENIVYWLNYISSFFENNASLYGLPGAKM